MTRRNRSKAARECLGKNRYRREQALAVAAWMRRTKGALVHVYRCRFDCFLNDGSKAWHVGHTIPRRKRLR